MNNGLTVMYYHTLYIYIYEVYFIYYVLTLVLIPFDRAAILKLLRIYCFTTG